MREAWLQGVPFNVDERCVIPRSLIAELIADNDEAGILDEYLSERTERVLDLWCGNANLAILAALHFPTISVTASDVSAPALEVAAANVARHKLASHVHLIQSDLFDAFDNGAQFDLILCNPVRNAR